MSGSTSVAGDVMLHSDLPLPKKQGKVRDIYDLGDRLLLVASDRVSAFDVVLPNGIPDKGRVLTQMSAFWFEATEAVVPNHMIRVIDSTANPDLPVALGPQYVGRTMLVRKAEPVMLEAIVRGAVSGSGWLDYQASGRICGIPLPPGLVESQALPEPIFTPSTKAKEGHDETSPTSRRRRSSARTWPTLYDCARWRSTPTAPSGRGSAASSSPTPSSSSASWRTPTVSPRRS